MSAPPNLAVASVRRLGFTQDERQVISFQWGDHSLRQWNMKSGQSTITAQLGLLDETVTDIASNLQIAAWLEARHRFRVWNLVM